MIRQRLIDAGMTAVGEPEETVEAPDAEATE